MKIAYVSRYDISNTESWSQKRIGANSNGYYKAQALKNQFPSLEYIGPLENKNLLTSQLIPKVKKYLYKHLYKKVYHAWAEPSINKSYAYQITQKLPSNSEVVVCPDPNPIAYLECKKPIVLWTTNLYTALIDFYSDYFNLCKETIQNFITMDKLALDKCQLAVFPSDWAAQTAIETYQIDQSKVKVVPYGANTESDKTVEDIKDIIEARPLNKCKLLFLGLDWFRKGGDVTLEIASELKKAGTDVELTIVGCQPITNGASPDFINSLGFINRFTKEGFNRINELIAQSHFLIVPSRAETYGNVFCEANSFGVPSISTDVGGIPTIIKDNLNGKVFSRNANIAEYCTYISNVFSNYSRYKELALSSFNQYQTRLNWSIAGQSMKKLLLELV
jgi:glycosyltransferase involved in cell wall biosynthesis